MPIGKHLRVHCDRPTAQAFATAVRAYAEAAYPPGGSECAQVAHQTLLDTASACEIHTDGALRLRKRQLPMLRAAVRWSLSENASTRVESLRDLAERLTAT